ARRRHPALLPVQRNHFLRERRRPSSSSADSLGKRSLFLTAGGNLEIAHGSLFSEYRLAGTAQGHFRPTQSLQNSPRPANVGTNNRVTSRPRTGVRDAMSQCTI